MKITNEVFYVIYDRVTKKFITPSWAWNQSVKAATKWFSGDAVCKYIDFHRHDYPLDGKVKNLDVLEVTETYSFKNVLNPEDEQYNEIDN